MVNMKNIRIQINFAIIALCTLGCTAIAYAEKADRKLKVNVSSLESDGDYGKGIYKLSKNVLVTQGTLKISADRADIRADQEEQYKAVLTAKPVCFQQRTDKGDWAQGIAERVEYDSKAGVVELFGGAVLFVGDDETRANYILYNTQAGTYESRDSKDRKSSASGKGVTFVLQPREKDEPAPAATSAADVKPATTAAAATPNSPKAASKTVAIVKTATPPKRNEPAFSRCA